MILFDGICGFCNLSVHFVLDHDDKGIFCFTPLQGRIAESILREHGIDQHHSSTMYVLTDWESDDLQIIGHSSAALFVLRHLPWPWKALAALRLVPKPLRDWAYKLFTNYRYMLFGRFDSCPAPEESFSNRFVNSTNFTEPRK